MTFDCTHCYVYIFLYNIEFVSNFTSDTADDNGQFECLSGQTKMIFYFLFICMVILIEILCG